MVSGTLNKVALKCTCLLLSLWLVGCQSSLNNIGQEHAKEVVKWQELARYAGNELKYLELTVTAGVQINQSADKTSYSIVKVQLNRDSNITEIDLLSPEFAEKFACGKECQKLGLYDSNFAKQETQLTSFFFTEEGRFFEFYGRLTRLNDTLADYRASSPAILKKYITLLLNRKLVFNSLSEFLDHIEMHITEDKLLAYSESGFISPVNDRLSSTFLDDVIANIPNDWQLNELIIPDADDNWGVNNLILPDADWQANDLILPNTHWQADDSTLPDANWQANNLIVPDANWQANNLIVPDANWQANNLILPDAHWNSNALKPDRLFMEIEQNLPTSYLNWEQAKQYTIQAGSIACTFSDNSFGVVKKVEANKVILKVIAQARVIVDGMKLYPQPGHLFTAVESFYFVKGSLNDTYPLSDIATCNIEHLKRGQKVKKA
jgi:hypothetical protein